LYQICCLQGPRVILLLWQWNRVEQVLRCFVERSSWGRTEWSLLETHESSLGFDLPSAFLLRKLQLTYTDSLTSHCPLERENEAAVNKSEVRLRNSPPLQFFPGSTSLPWEWKSFIWCLLLQRSLSFNTCKTLASSKKKSWVITFEIINYFAVLIKKIIYEDIKYEISCWAWWFIP
jgi:hypothetical protein